MSDERKREDFSDAVMEEFPEKNKSRRSRRKKNARKAARKRRISREVYDHDWYDNLHEYSKGKVHCSCPMCSGLSKTNSKKSTKGGAKPQAKPGQPMCVGFGTTNHRNGKNWKFSDLKKLEELSYNETD